MIKCLQQKKKTSNKIFPKSFSFGNECCICLSRKFKTKKCDICKSGIICINCQKILPEEHRNKCPICRSNTEAFIIKIRQEQQVKRTKKIKCSNTYSKFLKLLSCKNIVIFICFLLLSYGLGLVIMASIIGIKPESIDHFLTFIIGMILLLFLSKCFHCCCCDIFCED